MAVATFKAKRIKQQNKIISFMSNFMKNKLGRGPQNIKVKILEDIIEVEFKGYLVDIEKSLLGNKDPEDIRFVNEIRERFFAKNINFIEEYISEIVEKEVKFLFAYRSPIEDVAKLTLIIE
ncbi:Na-translocating system protein MpsC family protein [Wukongibacter baidiensis]|uniref:Na-translocating system protein MpsC family protein n=1 Tax=Wukongibacter baidiensis TaxID=1723361 RepID=UPI003D7FF52A